jgi:hypothetical protein
LRQECCLKIEREIAECARRTRGSEADQGFGESFDLIILSDSDALSSETDQRDSRSESQ